MFRAFAISGQLEQIAPARGEILSFLQDQGCPEESCFEIGMALQEALANAVIHGCKQNGALMLSVEVATSSGSVSIIVRDPGHGFDPARIRDPRSPEGMVAQSGRGLTLMRAYMDEVTFTRGGTEVRMHKRWRTAQTA